jgi:hypothetical protein
MAFLGQHVEKIHNNFMQKASLCNLTSSCDVKSTLKHWPLYVFFFPNITSIFKQYFIWAILHLLVMSQGFLVMSLLWPFLMMSQVFLVMSLSR